MKAYITCPVSHTNNRLNLLPEIKSVVEQNGIEPFVFEIGGTPDEIFNRDYSNLKTSQILIAEVSERSHGVGIEIGLSYALNLKRILLIEKGQFVSKLAQGLPGTIMIEYDSVDDLKDKLNIELNKVTSNF
jgi:hypothetical protein